MLLQNTPRDWAYQVHMYAYGHNSQPFSSSNVSPHEIVFHTPPRIPFTFNLNGLVEVQNKNLGTHLRVLLQNTPRDWAYQVHIYAYGHNS